MPATPLERTVRAARRRLVVQLLLNRLAVAWAAALLLGLGWVLAEPWLLDAAPRNLKWYVVGGLAAVGTVAGVWLAVRAAPTRQAAALELDSRFALKERVTTALGLDPAVAATPAGQAVLADAAAKVAPVSVRSKFPVRLGWPSATVPALAGCLALAAVFYHPNTARTDDGPADAANGTKLADATTVAQQQAKKAAPAARPKTPEELDRGDKSEKLKELENELEKIIEKYNKGPDADKPERQREKVTEITALEEKAKQFDKEKFEKLARMEQQLRQLDRLSKNDDLGDGPAKMLNDALAKGDLKKAQEEVDQLRKKAKDKTLDKEDQEKLARQLDQMKQELERLAKNKDREDKLKDMIDKAKKEGKDADSLERELSELQKEGQEAGESVRELAQRLNRAKQAAEKGDLEEVAKELAEAGEQLKNIEGDLQDLEGADEFLQRLKSEREQACKNCKGGKGPGDGKPGDKDDAEWSEFTNPASGRRPENRDAKTSGQDERVKGLFDPRGKKVYGGSTRGQAFTKRTTADLGKEIQEAVQEAPQAADGQRLPRDAREAVKEYFENLGGQTPGGNK